MEIISQGSSSVKDEGFLFDIFLSFRGSDVRLGFLGHLHRALNDKGLRTFLDSEDLERGQRLEELFDYIKRSKVFVVVFSKGYADSRWCLKEIAHIVKCKRAILPVFFDVEPGDVRNQRGPFESAFERHEQDPTVDDNQVREWRDAMKEAGGISGYSRKDTSGYEAKLVRIIVTEVLKRCNRARFDVPYTVGVDEPLNAVKELLQCEANNIGSRIIGIHGIGGIGKTTLAKAIYNGLMPVFDAVSFLSEVKNRKLASLQKQLLRDLSGDKNAGDISDHAIYRVVKYGKKALIILDDINDSQQPRALGCCKEWLSPQNWVIITTRNSEVLKQLKISKEVDEIYELQPLNPIQSLELFCHHAFFRPNPPEGYERLAKEVVEMASGLPLALKVYGSLFLTLNGHIEWHLMLQKLKDCQSPKIRERLKASFDVLDRAQKEIFLDIACFTFRGQAKEAIYTWREFGFHPEIDLGVLACMSLVKPNDDGGFEMHDEIRRMGRQIVMDECPEDTSTCSRLWKTEDIHRALENTEGTCSSRTRGMIVEDPHARFRTGSFAGKNKLKILHACGATFDGEPPHLPKTMLWLSWRFFRSANSFPALFRLEDLVVLDLSDSMITRLWNQREQGMKVLEKMKYLILARCRSLVICPDFSLLPSLEKLELGHCSKLSELHKSIGCLENLRELDISGCRALEILPGEICQLTSLENIDLRGCYGLRALPTQFGRLKSLKELHLLEAEFTCLPVSVSNLESLTSLSVVDCQKLKRLPENIGNVKTLTKLCISTVPLIKSLPNSIVHLTNLRSLVVGGCDALVNIPGSIGSLEKLEELSLVMCDKLAALPSSIQRLTNLQLLEIGGKNFSASSIVGHPGAFPLLKRLELRDSHESGSLPSDLVGFSRLEELSLDGFLSLHAFPGIPSSMKSIWVWRCPALSSMSSISDCSGLQNLTICDCPMVVDLQVLGSLCQLKELSLDCIGITSLPQLPESITTLGINRCAALTAVPDISNLQDLRRLFLEGCAALTELPLISNLKMLTCLVISGCRMVEDIPQPHSSLAMFIASDCVALKTIRTLSTLQDLQRLELTGCVILDSVEGIQNLTKLHSLELKGCLFLDVRRLKELFIFPCHPREFSVSALPFGVKRTCLPLPRSVRLEDMKLSIVVTGKFPAGHNVKLRIVFIADGLVQLHQRRTQRPIAEDPDSFYPDEFEVHTLQKKDQKGRRDCMVRVSVFPGSIYRVDLSLTPIHVVPMEDYFPQIYGARLLLDYRAEDFLERLAETSKVEEWTTQVALQLRNMIKLDAGRGHGEA